MGDILLTILMGFIMLIGLVAVFVPVVPEMILIWGAALGYGLLVGWAEPWGWWAFAAITVLGVLGGVAEFWVSGTSAKISGASGWSLLAGVGLGILGLLILPPLGGLIGLIAGMMIVEVRRQGDYKKALKSVLGLGVGYGVSFGIKFGIGLLMFIIWLLWVLAQVRG